MTERQKWWERLIVAARREANLPAAFAEDRAEKAEASLAQERELLADIRYAWAAAEKGAAQEREQFEQARQIAMGQAKRREKAERERDELAEAVKDYLATENKHGLPVPVPVAVSMDKLRETLARIQPKEQKGDEVNGFIVTVISHEGISEYRVRASEVTEKLRHIGLEWKTADWPHDQAVMITVRPGRDA